MTTEHTWRPCATFERGSPSVDGLRDARINPSVLAMVMPELVSLRTQRYTPTYTLDDFEAQA